MAAGYSKNIAVIKGIKSGFSADGGSLSGLVKAEKYGTFLRVDVTLINFAPLSEGRYIVAISDGANEEVFGAEGYEGESGVDTSFGFAAAILFALKGEVSVIATAICGDYSYAVEYAERVAADGERAEGQASYNDDAIAEENYYESAVGNEGGGPLREDEEEERETADGGEDEDARGLRQEPQKEVEAEPVPLARDIGFYSRMKPEIDKIFRTYPREECLERLIEGSRWAKISYGKNKYYVFGVIYMDGSPRCICYGVPSKNSKTPPASLKGMAGYIPADDGGYWVMYQDAGTGASVKIDNI